MSPSVNERAVNGYCGTYSHVKKCFYELAGYLIARYFFTTTEDSQAAKY
jgi:hypothetical protein